MLIASSYRASPAYLRPAILLLGAAAYATAMATLVAAIEEPRLARRFGSYDAYRRAVPGWLPRRRRDGS